jgi:uncharacterized protein YpuA (DUF1002 family)
MSWNKYYEDIVKKVLQEYGKDATYEQIRIVMNSMNIEVNDHSDIDEIRVKNMLVNLNV